MFFFNDTATTEIYTLSLHDALPISVTRRIRPGVEPTARAVRPFRDPHLLERRPVVGRSLPAEQFGPVRALERKVDRKSTRLNSSHANISYAVFCLKKTSSFKSRQPL